MKNVSIVVSNHMAIGKTRNITEDSVKLVGHEGAQLDAVTVLILYDVFTDIGIEILETR
jgi:hypothetical protein